MPDKIASVEIHLHLADDHTEEFTRLQPSESVIRIKLDPPLDREQVERELRATIRRLEHLNERFEE